MPGHVKNPVRSLGVLTGGGDVPGLNVAIKALVYRAEPLGIRVVGIRAGWEGITFLNRSLDKSEIIFREDDRSSWKNGYIMPLSRLNTRDIDRLGGTILHSTRYSPLGTRVANLPEHLKSYGEGKQPHERVDLTQEVIANMDHLGLDGLIVLGGDGTLSYGAKLAAAGIPVWAIPKTMDNDVPGTEYSIGFQTAISRAAEFINRVRSTVSSHRQTAIFRLFGRDAGFTALETAVVTWADRLVIPEVPIDIERLSRLVIRDREHNPKNYSLVLASEGVVLDRANESNEHSDPFVHKKKANVAEILAEQLSERIPEVRFLPIDLTYVLRSGEPEVYDKHASIYFANVIMNSVAEGMSGVMAAFHNGEFICTDIPSKAIPARRVNPTDYHEGRYRPRFECIKGRYRSQEDLTQISLA
ncbi:6-phosphofructokinase [Ktedonobacter sp. SOSP1-85]|uniref:6-phosphofructokinase n=1 Tax=Ktedonobacter sp. SOSP1-85 TaxID=2778367 RepID=UPI00191574D6|nr:6-phosphofructokinase [Ktedonobacter sp. SOSP1-85]GHO74143.1 6-phosphofructokinase [Ktedonobacter sp. SOSP1-85]